MVLSAQCRFKEEQITIEQALKLRTDWTPRLEPPLDFYCSECGKHVIPHRGRTPHFEHLVRDPNCPLSSKHRQSNKTTYIHLNVDERRAIEGYESDRLITTYSRNLLVVASRKQQDNYTCVACGFYLQVEDNFIIECHHLERIADSGVREISIEDLVSLCPTCHRIAHTRIPSYSVAEIAALRNK